MLVMTPTFASTTGLELAELKILTFAGIDYSCHLCSGALDLLEHVPRPSTVDQALALATALAAIDEPVQGIIYDDVTGTLIPISAAEMPPLSKADVLGRYLTGGVEVTGDDIVALARIRPTFDEDDLVLIAAAAGLATKRPIRSGNSTRRKASAPVSPPPLTPVGRFELPGRLALADFFNEHVIDIVADEERYAALGIGFPGGIILEGPTGCGKTFAVERLIEHLGWPSFPIEASSVASPYIHETSRKVAQVFADAVKVAPSVIVIDEMDAFLSSREVGSQQHHVEEIAEFLRRIPEAAKQRVLVVGMTNQVEAIDPAILRRGRFDHVIHVDHAGRDEIAGLLRSLLADIPNDVSDLDELAGRLAGRPLSDVAFVVREAGRLTARARKERIGSDEIAAALARSPSRDSDDQRRIGF
ncbi:Cdc6-like AAA superfamily ATPase [Sphingomonas insulae]|uniref:AAA+ ATPase domain-containing protein n=2 Tax=Sphingomonas insulae TaxID=424800 RepID=A0ABP3T2N6_9SPHN|nr:Cdc6-like AAA superfamily ATPase [Sphingomonas insulae]